MRFPRGEASSAPGRRAIIDIGSNSIRLVVYDGARRLPHVLYNEKVLAGLGASLNETGTISDDAMALARPALARFAAIARELEVDDLRTVATAAVRDASNGDVLLSAAEQLGLTVSLLSGEEEATAAGYGVLSAFPDADGIVGDLGGGSLELVRIANGEVLDRASFPLGVLRVGALRAKGKRSFEKKLRALIDARGLRGKGRGLPFYLVGGSWRALARLDMDLTGYPLPVINGYHMRREDISRLRRTLAHLSKGKLREIPNLSNGRIPMLPDAAALLEALLVELDAAETIVSAFGLREGLLYQALSPEERDEDPLIVHVREEGARLGRFAEHGDLLNDWIASLFSDEDAATARLRHAACLLADVGWLANPEFRAERAMEVALHGNWVAIDARGRALVSQALFTAMGGGPRTPEPLQQLADPNDLYRAMQWGLAIRLGQRWSGGVAGPLQRSRLRREGDALALVTPVKDHALYSETVQRRHRALAQAMELTATLGESD